ncbi:MAG TPA: universal stress protein [Planctomycetota bacterium]|nr:universal stress protein [Planctomycetota bacterium]
MLDHLLVPLNGAPGSESVLPHVRRLARAGVREITLFRAELPIALDPLNQVGEAAIGSAREYLLDVRERLADLKVHCRVVARIGSPAQAILEAARDRGATLIFLATNRRRGLARLLFGSVSKHVIRESPVPVLAVPPEWSYELAPAVPTDLRPVREILVPLDQEEDSFQILPCAIDVARRLHAKIHLLHVLPGGGPRAAPADEAEERDVDPPPAAMDAGLERAFRGAGDRCVEAGVETLSLVRSGEVVPTLLRVCRERKIDWIAMATHGRSGLARWMNGSVTEGMLQGAGIPMLIVRSWVCGAGRIDRSRPGRSLRPVGGGEA